MSKFYKSFNKNILSVRNSNTEHSGHSNKNQGNNQSKFERDFEDHWLIKKLIVFLQGKTVKGFKGHSFYDVGRYFLRSIFKENLSIRASSLSFNFFLALFPALIFLLTLIAFLPIKGMKTQFIEQLSMILPNTTYEQIADTILEILNKQNSKLLSFGFLLTIYFASNAFHILINSFNRRLAIGQFVQHNWLYIRFKAIFLTFILSILIIVFLVLVTWAYQIEGYMESNDWPLLALINFFIEFFKYILITGLFILVISSIYYFGPSNKKRWEFFSAGSLLAGTLSIISTFGFTLYVNNFDSYNKIYGSIGAILALMVLIYINSFLIIVGFELNTSIDKAEVQKTKLNAEKNKLVV
jgi:membrane protein